jgi:small subunit ribosomal protein S18
MKMRMSSKTLQKKKRRRSSFQGKKHCRFCANDANSALLDYKNSTLLRSFITERGKILASRISGNCAGHQRQLACEIKNARIMALLPYTAQ